VDGQRAVVINERQPLATVLATERNVRELMLSKQVVAE
jgi:hypothetical protein